MSDSTNIVELHFNETREVSFSFHLDHAAVVHLISKVENTPLVLPTPLGDIEILPDKRDALRQIMEQQPLNVELHVAFQAYGDPAHSSHIGIGYDLSQLTGTHQVNIAAFGFGATISLRAEIHSESLQQVVCKYNQHRKSRKFIIDWMLDFSDSPGATSTQRIKRIEQLVQTPCFAINHEKPHHDHNHDHHHTEQKKGKGGWFD